ncbi:hypothetical protein EI77_02570 [Prosthecobacter fusiformis]|uniref:Uncharacterized protein n=1 Tax=Prosthecobacter fusiformis TaxID=48464 RepID=A0A4R7S1P9_9BACT|nr:hypothetical protein [Prosthecobacter fusiformis]TDU71446.1 hypothetical protein EI77_02570 [Prosthecobacter fusiformis]
MPPPPRSKASSLRDLDGDGDVDLADDPINDLDNDGRIDADDREIHDLDNDNDIDAADRLLKEEQAKGLDEEPAKKEERTQSVGEALGLSKNDGKWQRSQSQAVPSPGNSVK